MPAKKVISDKKKEIRKNKKPATTEDTEKNTEITKKKQRKTVVARKPVSAETVKRSKTGSLKIDVYDTKGKIVESINLPKEIFGAKVNNQLIAQAVRVYLANQRKGTASTKTRGEVAGSTRKIYRQKGTGRARHGSIRAPIFVKGGVVFGPKPRDYSLNLPKKMKKAALFSALSVKAKEGKIKAISGLEKIEPKTKLMAQVLKNLSLNGEKVLVILPSKMENVQRGLRNIKNIELTLVQNLNTYQVLKYKTLLFMTDSFSSLAGGQARIKKSKGESK